MVSEVLKAFNYEVLVARDGSEAIEMTAIEQPDLLLLDIMFPQGPDGYKACQRIREFSDVPIIMLTAKAKEVDKLQGFDSGADDYLTKPFSSKELVARVKAVLKRTRRPNEKVTSSFTCGKMVINFANHSVRLNNQAIILSKTEFALLREMAQHPNRVITHKDLLTAVWGQEYRDDIDYLRAYIRYLRMKLEEDPANPKYLTTAPGVGYMLSCPEE